MKRLSRLFLPFLCLSLTACGFQPMYGAYSASAQHTEAGAALSGVEISVIPDRDGQILRNELIDRLHERGNPQQPKYVMNFAKLLVRVHELDLTKEAEATRAQIIASTVMTLTDKDTGEIVLKRPVKSVSSYNILPSEFATNVTEDNARTNALLDIARQAEQQLTLYFNR